MSRRPISKLSSKKRYLQVALNSTLEEARKIISQLPISERILVEAGTLGITVVNSWLSAVVEQLDVYDLPPMLYPFATEI